MRPNLHLYESASPFRTRPTHWPSCSCPFAFLAPFHIPRSLSSAQRSLSVRGRFGPGIRRPVRLLIRIPIRNCQSGLQSAVRATIRIVVRCIADTRERSRVTSSDLVRRIALPSFGAPQLSRHPGQGSAASIRLGFLSIKVFLIIFSLSFSDVFCAKEQTSSQRGG